MLHIWNDWIPEMLNSVTRFFGGGSNMTACEWETRWNPEGAFGKHASPLRETWVYPGREELLPCNDAAVELRICPTQQIWGCPLFIQCHFKLVLILSASDCPSILHQPGKKYVPNKCEQYEPNQRSFHAVWTCSSWGRGHWFDLHYKFVQ